MTRPVEPAELVMAIANLTNRRPGGGKFEE